jgi:DNA polymerase elongation subunit (family B)
MKNEFFNTLLVIGKAKKRYISKQKLREGNLLIPPKSDIKGFDLKKASTSEYAETVFMKLISNMIINQSHEYCLSVFRC